MSKLAIVLGLVVLAVAFGAAPMPLTTMIENRSVTIYPNVLFAVPLVLLGALLLLYGATSRKQ